MRRAGHPPFSSTLCFSAKKVRKPLRKQSAHSSKCLETVANSSNAKTGRSQQLVPPCDKHNKVKAVPTRCMLNGCNSQRLATSSPVQKSNLLCCSPRSIQLAFWTESGDTRTTRTTRTTLVNNCGFRSVLSAVVRAIPKPKKVKQKRSRMVFETLGYLGDRDRHRTNARHFESNTSPVIPALGARNADLCMLFPSSKSSQRRPGR